MSISYFTASSSSSDRPTSSSQRVTRTPANGDSGGGSDGLDAVDHTCAAFVAGPLTAGPWSDRLQHGGPPNALAVTMAERELVARGVDTPFAARRVATDFVGPAPVGPLETHTRVVRVARSAALVDVTLRAAGRDCLRSRVWFVRVSDTSALVAPEPGRPVHTVPDVPDAEEFTFGYGTSLRWRYERGRARDAGPATVWCRPTVPLLPDAAPLSPLANAVLIADSASGVSAELDWDTWSFVNVDLDVHVVRPQVGDWLRMDAVTTVGAYGSAICRSTLSDGHGVLGAGLQTLVLAPLHT